MLLWQLESLLKYGHGLLQQRKLPCCVFVPNFTTLWMAIKKGLWVIHKEASQLALSSVAVFSGANKHQSRIIWSNRRSLSHFVFSPPRLLRNSKRSTNITFQQLLCSVSVSSSVHLSALIYSWALRPELGFIGKGIEVDKSASEVFCHILLWLGYRLHLVSTCLTPRHRYHPRDKWAMLAHPGPAWKQRKRESEGGD